MYYVPKNSKFENSRSKIALTLNAALPQSLTPWTGGFRGDVSYYSTFLLQKPYASKRSQPWPPDFLLFFKPFFFFFFF